ncbi:MAG TPA: SRPBCC family protein [Ktedonobacteraceae bacterium]
MKNMPQIEREIVINRPVEEVFDFLADGRNEPHYNPHMLRAEQTSAGPVGPGTQFRTEVTTRGRSMEMIYEITAYERPLRLAGRTLKGPIAVQSIETFASVPGGTHFSWVMELEPRGLLKLISPLVVRMMGRNLDTLLANIKRLLEAEPPPLPHT